jgi:hypothetical protein
LNKRDKAIAQWFAKNRPDIPKVLVDKVLNESSGQVLYSLSAAMFEAGRQFQSENPGLELNNPNVYLD